MIKRITRWIREYRETHVYIPAYIAKSRAFSGILRSMKKEYERKKRLTG